MSSVELKRLNSIINTNLTIADELMFMRGDLKTGLEKLREATVDLKNKNSQTLDEGAWRKVEHVTDVERYPLVKSDVDNLIKKLDII